MKDLYLHIIEDAIKTLVENLHNRHTGERPYIYCYRDIKQAIYTIRLFRERLKIF